MLSSNVDKSNFSSSFKTSWLSFVEDLFLWKIEWTKCYYILYYVSHDIQMGSFYFERQPHWFNRENMCVHLFWRFPLKIWLIKIDSVTSVPANQLKNVILSLTYFCFNKNINIIYLEYFIGYPLEISPLIWNSFTYFRSVQFFWKAKHKLTSIINLKIEYTHCWNTNNKLECVF